ncbi:MAG: DUF5681 domain-containing protein [Thermomicrobiales bacterium]
MPKRRKTNVVPLPTRQSDAVGYKRPPVHSQFKPGQSGNPSGRPKGGQNLKTLFHKILKEEVSLREGADVRKVTKAEAVMRGLVIGALKGDTRSMGTLFRLAEQTGQFDEDKQSITSIQRIIITGVQRPGDEVPGSNENNKDVDDDE